MLMISMILKMITVTIDMMVSLLLNLQLKTYQQERHLLIVNMS